VTPDAVIDGEYDTQGWNRYSYCRNNPIIYSDPTGNNVRDRIWIIADAVGEKIRYVGEEIRSIGEKLTQPLRDKLHSNKESANKRTRKPNDVVHKTTIIECIEVPIEKEYHPAVTSKYGLRKYDKKFHRGIDAVPQKNKEGRWMTKEQRIGTPIISLGEGKVTFAGETEGGGNTIVIDHSKGIESVYMHLDKITVREEQRLRKGEQVGTLGYTGKLRGTGPHIHWEIRKDAKQINPQNTTVEQEVRK